jgi:hypothetical protein
MTDDTLLLFDLPAVRRKKLTVDFDGGNQSSDGGLLVLRHAERKLGVCGRRMRCRIAAMRAGLPQDWGSGGYRDWRGWIVGAHAGIPGGRARGPAGRASADRRRDGPSQEVWPNGSEGGSSCRSIAAARSPASPRLSAGFAAPRRRAGTSGAAPADRGRRCSLRRARRRPCPTSYGEPGGANGARHVVGVKPVEGRLVQAVQRRLRVLSEVPPPTTSWCWVPVAPAIRLAMGPSFSSCSSKARVKVWMGLWAARCARLATADESTPPERETARGTSLARWSLSPSPGWQPDRPRPGSDRGHGRGCARSPAGATPCRHRRTRAGGPARAGRRL